MKNSVEQCGGGLETKNDITEKRKKETDLREVVRAAQKFPQSKSKDREHKLVNLPEAASKLSTNVKTLLIPLSS